MLDTPGTVGLSCNLLDVKHSIQKYSDSPKPDRVCRDWLWVTTMGKIIWYARYIYVIERSLYFSGGSLARPLRGFKVLKIEKALKKQRD